MTMVPLRMVQIALSLPDLEVVKVAVDGEPPSPEMDAEIRALVFKDGSDLVLGPWRIGVSQFPAHTPGGAGVTLGAPWPWPVPDVLIGKWGAEPSEPPEGAKQHG